MPTTVKHLSYSGVTLLLPTPELERNWLARLHPPYDFVDTDFFNFDKPTAVGVPTPPVPRPTDFKLNTLFWPSSASRPAWFHCVVESTRLDALRTAVGVHSALAPLVFYDGRSGKTVTAQMRMLPERPFNITVGGNTETFWLVTLTDDRYFWYLKRGVITAPTSWTNLFSQLGTLIGHSITVDTINSGYGVPSAKWTTNYESPGSLLDAAAYQVGQRVVVALDGTVRTVNWETAQSASDAYFATADAPVSGGRVSATGIVRCAPSSVNTVFAQSSGGGLSPTPYAVNNTLASLSVPGYGAATGIAGYADTVFGDGTYTGTNGAALATYATAAATDLYGWRLSDPDVAWPGIEPWVPTGWEERVEWTMKVRDDGPFALTTVRRGPWMEFVGGDYSSGLRPSGPCPNGLVPGCAPPLPGSGSGSGSGSGGGDTAGYCEDKLLVAEAFCVGGSRTLIAKEIDISSNDGRLLLTECSTVAYDLGPCSPDNPTGTPIAIMTAWCPVYETIEYLDWDSNPQSVRVVVGGVSQRVIGVVPIAGPMGCISFDEAFCCSGSGSGSGSGQGECTELSTQCPGGMSTEWDIVAGFGFGEKLLYNFDPDSGNTSEFYSDDIAFLLEYTLDGDYWSLKYLNSFPYKQWVKAGADWDCNGINVMEPVDVDDGEVTLNPTFNCGGSTQTSCCGPPIPNTLYLHTSSCSCVVSAVPMTYNGSGSLGAGWYSSNISCDGDILSFVWQCVNDTPVTWRLTVRCSAGPDTSGEVQPPEEVCNFSTGVSCDVPTLGNCCDIGFTGIVTDAA